MEVKIKACWIVEWALQLEDGCNAQENSGMPPQKLRLLIPFLSAILDWERCSTYPTFPYIMVVSFVWPMENRRSNSTFRTVNPTHHIHPETAFILGRLVFHLSGERQPIPNYPVSPVNMLMKEQRFNLPLPASGPMHIQLKDSPNQPFLDIYSRNPISYFSTSEAS